MTKKFTDNRLPYAVVEAAVRGDAEALEKVLECHNSYICKLSTRKIYDDLGNLHYEVDCDMKSRIESMLVRAIIMNFKIDYDSDK